MSYWEVLRLPIRVFQQLSRNVVRIMAERELHTFECHAALQVGGEDATEFRQRLLDIVRRGAEALDPDHAVSRVEIEEEQLDTKGLNELRAWH